MKLKIALAIAAASAMPAAAQAAYQIDHYAFAPGALVGTVQYTPTGLNVNAGIGRLNLTGTETPGGAAASFLTYCVDIFHDLTIPATFDFAPVSTLIPDATKQSQLLTLMTQSDALLANASDKTTVSAAIQLATWEIVNETSGSYGFATGTFRSTGGNSDAARSLAQTYLNQITTGAWQPSPTGTLRLLYSATSQSQIIAGVPEPATWAMMIGGFGLVGAAARRRARVKYVIA
ncbi:PEPxxWA-CTERM sorting domain-containing protein [Sphingomonas tabacisoli]|uniref:PEPxxWA-CTERM sorting domain-containing protein n=1 Tax=Sphingomonas tabacisoli TaxID=2249466 RepID=A0ABW4HY36_9SPHN